MGIFDRIVSPSAAISHETITSSKDLLEVMFDGPESSSGVTVSQETALKYTTALICIRVLSESVASLPCILYKRRADGGKDRATDHPSYRLLHDQVNDWQTAFQYFEGSMVNLATRGNCYSYVERDRQGRVTKLWPLNPDGVQIKQSSLWTPEYSVVMPNNKRKTLSPDEMHHVAGPVPSGFVGRSMISLAKDAIGLGLAAEKFGSHLYKNGVKPSGVLKHPGKIGPEGVEVLRQQFEKKYAGLSNSSRPLLLEEGMEWIALSINPDDAQFLETRKFQRSEIAGIFRVPAHLVNDLERATFSNIEHQTLDFITHSLRPWLKRWEQAASRDLLPASDREDYFFEFLMDDMLRGDTKSRYEAYSSALQNKWMSANEVRTKENLNPREGGDVYENPAIQVDRPESADSGQPSDDRQPSGQTGDAQE